MDLCGIKWKHHQLLIDRLYHLFSVSSFTLDDIPEFVSSKSRCFVQRRLSPCTAPVLRSHKFVKQSTQCDHVYKAKDKGIGHFACIMDQHWYFNHPEEDKEIPHNPQEL